MTVLKVLALPAALLLAHQNASAELIFTDQSEATGLELTELLTQSAAWGDYDDDGDPDLYLTNRGRNTLFRNDGNGVFTDVTDLAGVAGPLTTEGDGIGTAFGDLDNDGDLDLYVSHINSGDDQLYRNDGFSAESGMVVFTDVAATAGTTVDRSARGMALVDFDRDGLLDIYVLATGASMMYRNQGDLTFVDVAADLGLAGGERDVGVVASDLDNNGWPDLFVANRSSDPTNLFMNDQGSFTDVAQSAGITATGLGMGVISLDYDNDLDFDLYWTTWPGEVAPFVGNRFYRNDGSASFTDVTSQTQTQDLTGWGISANIGDLDNDGFMDFFVTNGFDPSSTGSILFQNAGDGSFDNVTSLLGGLPADGRGVTFVDYDGDGDQDLLVTAGLGESNRLYRNDSTEGNRSVTLALRSQVASGIGARVEVQTNLGTTVQEVSGGTGRGNQNPLDLIFGLGQAESIEQVRIRWPSGQQQIIADLPLDARTVIREPGPQFHQYSGSWFGGPDQSGHGFSLEELADNRYLAYWYVFNNEGQRYWIIMDGQRQLNRISGTAFTVEGGAFPPLFDVDNATTIEWGELSFVFDDCNQGTVSWVPVVDDLSSGSLPIQRLATLAGVTCQ